VLSERRPTDPAEVVSPNQDLGTDERRLSVAAEQSDAMPPTKSPSKLIDSASSNRARRRPSPTTANSCGVMLRLITDVDACLGYLNIYV